MTVRLPVAKVVYGAFVFPWWNRRAFARALAIPLVLLVSLSLSWYYAGEYLPKKPPGVFLLALFLYAMFGTLFSLFAVTCHRLVLLDTASVASRVVPQWSWRETRFFFWLVAVWLIWGGTVYALVMLITTLLGLALVGLSILGLPITTSNEDWSWQPIVVVAAVPAFYMFARFCLVFPATAIDRKVDLKWAWRLTRGNGWRLVAVVTLLPWLISEIVSLLYRANATAVETVILTFLGIALFAVEIAALSLSYRELTKEEDS